MDKWWEHDIDLALASVIPAYGLRQECIDLLFMTRSCLDKTMVLKAFWLD